MGKANIGIILSMEYNTYHILQITNLYKTSKFLPSVTLLWKKQFFQSFHITITWNKSLFHGPIFMDMLLSFTLIGVWLFLNWSFTKLLGLVLGIHNWSCDHWQLSIPKLDHKNSFYFLLLSLVMAVSDWLSSVTAALMYFYCYQSGIYSYYFALLEVCTALIWLWYVLTLR